MGISLTVWTLLASAVDDLASAKLTSQSIQVPITIRDEIDLLVRPNECWSGEHSFELCCHGLADLYTGNFHKVLRKEATLHGFDGCFGKDFTYERCCPLNANMEFVIATPPNWSHAMWLVELLPRVGPRRVLSVIQGAVLEQWFQKGLHADLQGIPYTNVTLDGTLWTPGNSLLLELIDFQFPVSDAKRFLDLAAGTGLASLIALARGFSVWSTDLYLESQWQRYASAVASFGPDAVELSRFHTSALDILDPASWPQESFDVVHFVQARPQRHAMKPLCQNFRALLRSLLACGGVALYFRIESVFPTAADVECTWPEPDFRVLLHHSNGSDWSSEEITERWYRVREVTSNTPMVFTIERSHESCHPKMRPLPLLNKH